MSYTSLAFIVSVFVCTIIYYIFPSKYRWTVLLLASVLFYLLNSGILTLYLVGATVIIYVVGLLISREKAVFNSKKKDLEKQEKKALKQKTEKKTKIYEWVGICLLLLPLIVLKYSPMIVTMMNNALEICRVNVSFEITRFVLPLGISYYTLMAISYLSDVRVGKIEAEKNFFKLSLFTFFFPHITEGPFSRYGDLSKDLFAGRQADPKKMVEGIYRFIYGLIKKMVIADRAAFVVNDVFANSAQYGSIQIITASVFYVIQLYAEFSGCIDIVCGISEVLGITLPENFRQPFFSRSVDEFWRRWHISLGSWLRDYVFYPISFSKTNKKLGNKCREKMGDYYGVLVPTAIALFVVWFLIGFWHGASFKFLFYGLYYYALMMLGKFAKPLIDKILEKLNISRDSKGYKAFDIIRTNLLVSFGMLIFRADKVSSAFSLVKEMFTAGMNSASIFAIKNFTVKDLVVVVIGVASMLLIDIVKEKGIDVKKKLSDLPVLANIVIFVLLVYILIVLGIYGQGSGASPFIYGQY